MKADLPDGVTPVTGYLGDPDSLPAALDGGVGTSTSAATSGLAGTSTGVSFTLRSATMRFDRS